MPIILKAEQFDTEQLEHGIKESYLLTFEAEETQEVTIPVHVVKGANPGPTLLIMAAIHGDEYEGVHTLIELCRDLLPKHISGTLLIVSVANVLSYYGISRTTPEDECNLAREFPGKADGSVTQRLAWHLNQQLMAKADFLLDFHSGGAYLALIEFVGYYHHDSEVGRKSRAAAEAFGMEVVWGHESILPGRTVSTATEREIPWLYTEGYGGRRVNPEEQKNYRSGALRLMNHLGMLQQPMDWIQEDKAPIRHRLKDDRHFDHSSATAEVDGFFIPSVRLRDCVKKGDRIGAVYNWFGDELQTLIADEDALVVSLTGTPQIRKGMNLYMLASEWK